MVICDVYVRVSFIFIFAFASFHLLSNPYTAHMREYAEIDSGYF